MAGKGQKAGAAAGHPLGTGVDSRRVIPTRLWLPGHRPHPPTGPPRQPALQFGEKDPDPRRYLGQKVIRYEDLS